MQSAVSYSFSPTTTIVSSQVNQNFADLVNYFNNTACVTKMVTMWSGAIGSVPTGWKLCNGANSTPDLRDKFIMGAGNTYAIDAVGGAATHTHPGAEHTHYDDHQHSGRTGAVATNNDTANNSSSHTYYSRPNELHQHDVTTNYKSEQGFGANTGGVDRDITTGVNSALPPFYSLAFIQKD
jgi:hypothetical protein